MHSTNYRDILILPSPDSKVSDVVVPSKPGTIAEMQYERLIMAPYSMTSDELLFGIHADRNGIDEPERGPARNAYFSKGQACLRSSPLVKTFGWALHHDANSRIALIDPAGEAFEALAARGDITKLSGMRSKRA